MGILILKIISKFSKVKNLTKKGPLKFQKDKKSYKEYSNKKVIENRPPPKKVGILILNTISKFSKTKN